jgi:predicted CoA-binding protein
VDGDAVLRRTLTEFDHITVVGCSRDPAKSAHAVPARMQQRGYRITPINPTADELLGECVYRTLYDAPRPVDVVQLFRPSAEAAEHAKAAVEVGASALWLQSGIRSAEARRIAQEAGLLYVEDHCMAVDYIRLDITDAERRLRRSA